jgi:xylan 1,4-beta-xylosidase
VVGRWRRSRIPCKRDEFDRDRLRAGWQWPQDDEPSYRLDSKNGGVLVLAPRAERAKDLIGAVLARPTMNGDYIASTVLNIANLETNAFVGLSAFGDRANAMGLAVQNGKLVLWHRHRNKHEQLAEIAMPRTEKLHLRFSASEGHRFRFAASPDGQQWAAIGEDLQGRHLPPWDRSVRVALTVGGSPNAEGHFDSLKIVPSDPARN